MERRSVCTFVRDVKAMHWSEIPLDEIEARKVPTIRAEILSLNSNSLRRRRPAPLRCIFVEAAGIKAHKPN